MSKISKRDPEKTWPAPSAKSAVRKNQILKQFEALRRNIGRNILEIGNLISEVNRDSLWQPDYETFADYIEDVVGVAARTGYDFMAIARKWGTILPPDRLEESAAIGWTKMRALCPVITEENVDDWEARAEQMTLKQLQAEIKHRTGKAPEPGDNEGEPVTKFTFKMVGGQAEVLARALEIAGRMTNNDKPNVQLEMICAEFISTYEGRQDGGDPEEPAV